MVKAFKKQIRIIENSQKHLVYAKKSASDALKTISKEAIQKSGKSSKNLENPKNLEISYLFCKTSVVSIICGKCGNKHKKCLTKKNQLKY